MSITFLYKYFLNQCNWFNFNSFHYKNLGDAEYGFYTLIGAFIGYIIAFDFGLNNTIIRFVVKYQSESLE
jgi:hypothetical protein